MTNSTLEQKALWMRRATWASVFVGATLTILKAVVWVLTGSATMLASLTDSALDLLASLITFYGVRAALAPPDRDHRFGHSKAEGLAALAQGAIMLGSAIFLLSHSFGRLLEPLPVTMAWTGIAVSVFAIGLTLALVMFQRQVVRRTGSLAISADSYHYSGDLLLNAGVIVGLILSSYGGFAWADGLFGCLIAFYLAFHASRIARMAIDMLMDKELGDDKREMIFNIAMGNPQVRGLHDMKTRHAGVFDFIQLHLEVDAALTLREAHLIATEVEAAIGETFSDAEIIIFVDPVGFERPNLTVFELPPER